MAMQIDFRPAGPSDAPFAVPLIHSAGPQALEYGFSAGVVSATAFLAFNFPGSSGFFGYRNHRVAMVDGLITAIAACYDRNAYRRLSLAHAWLVWRQYPAAEYVNRMRRGLQLQALMPPPVAGMFYLANFGVTETLRGRGIGRAMLERQIGAASRAGHDRFALDVSVENPRALALYERCGLRVLWRNHFPGPVGAVPDTLRMELRL